MKTLPEEMSTKKKKEKLAFINYRPKHFFRIPLCRGGVQASSVLRNKGIFHYLESLKLNSSYMLWNMKLVENITNHLLVLGG